MHALVRLGALVALAAATLVLAQTYPSQPVTLVAPFAAGSGSDGVARTVSQKRSERLKQPVLVDNTCDTPVKLRVIYSPLYGESPDKVMRPAT